MELGLYAFVPLLQSGLHEVAPGQCLARLARLHGPEAWAAVNAGVFHVLEEEKRIYREQTLAEGKPENLVDKIVTGRLNKFYKEAVLLEQPFIKEDKQNVQKIVQGVASELGDEITPVMFFRFAIGD